MSKALSIETDLNELHNLNAELYEALHDDEFDEVKELCNKGIKAYRDIIASVRKNILLTKN